MRIALALDEHLTRTLLDDLPLAGAEVITSLTPDTLTGAGLDLPDADALILPADPALLHPALLAACDRAGLRILLLGDGDPAERLARRHGLHPPLPADSNAWQIVEALQSERRSIPVIPQDGLLLAVWGPHGAPGRTSLAIELSAALAAREGRVALIDADTYAPAIALLLGLTDDGPGIAAACRRAELGSLDAPELSRLAVPLETNAGTVEVLAGLNRPTRWPELSAERLRATLLACRSWAAHTVIDVAPPLDADEELLSDLQVPRRNAATRTVLEEADQVFAVTSADPLGIARFVRAHAEVRAHIGSTPMTVLVNRVRTGPLGIDARGQIRRALDRFSGITDVQFLPDDPRALDAALLHSRPVADVVPRAPFASAVRRLANGVSAPSTADAAPLRRERRRSSRRLLALSR
ncbi:CpaE family protein [Microbacterium keratanolyticum]|uniref:AAA family ATPase n=1 Tax=Microbacterium keratanolyticum TaxID=67574 RepID=UPI00362FB3BA